MVSIVFHAHTESLLIPGYPRKLLLLSPDKTEEAEINRHLTRAEDGKYNLIRVGTVEELGHIQLESTCHAVLLDMRIPHQEVIEAIQLIGSMKSEVALLCLCRNHQELLTYRDVIHLVDDYILAESLAGSELPTRIMHAIRRKAKESALLTEQNLLSSLLDNVPDNIYFKDLDSRFIKVSANMLKCYGCTSEEQLLGKTDADLFTEEHANAALEDEKRIMRTGEPLVGIIEKETLPNGRINWVSTTKIPLRDAKDQIIGTMGMSRYVTDLKNAQDQLANESRLLKTVIEHALAGIFVKDREGRYLIVNTRHAKHLGAHSVGEVIGKQLSDFFDPEEATQIWESDQAIMQSGQGVEEMIDHRKQVTGHDSWLLTSKVPLKDDLGECIGLVGISQDITSQKNIELKLKSTIQILEETKLQLIEAEKLKTIGRLAAGVAHEVKNPLAVVSLGVEYLLKRLKDDEALVGMLQDIQSAAEKANQVIFELLDYSAPHDMNMAPNQLNAVIEKVLALLRHNLNEARITVTQALQPDLPDVSMDVLKMEQVFINIVLNAIAAMSDGGELVVRSYTKQMQEGGSNVSGKLNELFRIGDRMVIVDIMDSGSGVSEQEESKVFDPFFSTKKTGDGTGLGLSVTRSIVEMHRGMITLKNRDDAEGARVRLVFPTSKNHEPETKKRPHPQP
jgi:PAS domain S-box-containing protein